MHVYIYDEYLNKKKYANVLAKIETRITDLSLNGKIVRLGIMKNLEAAIENELKQKIKTLIAVGGDKTFCRIVNALIKIEAKKQSVLNVPIAFIPVGQRDSVIARAIGSEKEELACNVLSARRIEKIDVAQANNSFFLNSACIKGREITIKMNKNYSIEILESKKVCLINLPDPKNCFKNLISKPQDGKLELLISGPSSRGVFKKNTAQSIFTIKEIKIDSPQNHLLLDNCLKIKTPVKIKTLKKRLNVVVGKKRGF